MKIKVSEASGPVLDWMVADVSKVPVYIDRHKALEMMESDRHDPEFWHPTTDWAQGGPIIEREEIAVQPVYAEGKLFAWNAAGHNLEYDENGEFIEGSDHNSYGPTPLIAAMRCYVASKLGDEVEVPDGLL